MFSRARVVVVLMLAMAMMAMARAPKRYADDDSFWMESYYAPDESPRPQPPVSAERDPLQAARDLACQPLVIHAFVMAWKSTMNGTRDRGLGESGFAIDSYMSTLSIQGWREASISDLFIPADGDTVAVAHVHGRAADYHPGSIDLRSRVPNFVISHDALYVTVPGTSGFTRVRGGVDDREGWNKPCVALELVAAR